MLFVTLAVLGSATAAPMQADTSYFQQGVDYRIEARLDDARGLLEGRLRLRYVNESRATLDTLWFHQHLNAFRPNSAWARRELEYGERRFQDLGPEEHAYERLRSVSVGGSAVHPVYPGAPDSTVVGIPLPRRLAPGDTAVVMMEWEARPSTLPRRQGRKGRHFDFAQWYPRIAVFDRGGWQVQPLLPQGEFYGEFGRYQVTLDVASDQVIGATGVPVQGDPGWREAAADPTVQIKYAHDTYPPTERDTLHFLPAIPPAGRKHVHWRADDVHHFGWSTSPDYIYEGGRHGDVLIHVLYQPGDTAWDDGVAVKRTVEAVRWMESLFGSYPYPQVTNVHRLESGGTEFPMLIMDGSASQSLILHEVAHIYAHGILANNEWREGWLDEGMASFVTSWYFEEHENPDLWKPQMERYAEFERTKKTQPIALASAEFVDPQMYGAMTYTKPSIVLRMLREYLGRDTMRLVLQDYFTENRFRHVTERDLKASAERVSGQDLDWFFEQWIHTTKTLDYAVAAASTKQRRDGTWETTIEVVRHGDAWMPVELHVAGVTERLEARKKKQDIRIRTQERPTEVVLDPRMVLLDVDWTNNRATL